MRQSSVKRALQATTILALPLLFASAANAADADDNGIQEIVVTAQRTAQNVLAVPVSLQAITGEQLSNIGIHNINSLEFAAPGFHVADSVGYTQIFVRGVGNSVFGYADPSVTQFIDDVPRLYPTMITDFIDVDRIELLKGAQGGIYGRNASGGVLNIITKQPSTDKVFGKASVSYGEKNTLRAQGYVNIPLSDKAAVMISADRAKHDPYVKNLSPAPYTAYTPAMFPNGSPQYGSPAATAAAFNTQTQFAPAGTNGEDLWALDGKILLKPTDNFKLTLAMDYGKSAGSLGSGLFGATPGYTQNNVQNIFFPLVAHITGVVLPPGFFPTVTQPFTQYESKPAHVHLVDYGTSATAVYSAPGFDVTSISAYRANRPQALVDVTPTIVPILFSNSHFHKYFLYEELRAVSTGEGPFHWLGGATYLYNHNRAITSAGILLPPVTLGLPGQAGVTDTLDVSKNWSVYLQAGYDFMTDFNLTVSGRYIHETHRTDLFVPVNPKSPVLLSESKFLPAATLTYKLPEGGNIYARYAKGFKAGGVNTGNDPSLFPTNYGVIFDPEVVNTYEVGYRNALLDHKLQITAAVFYNDYKNLQVAAHATPAFPQISFAIVNAPSARTWGAEGSVQYRVSKPLTVGVNIGYLNAKYKNYQITSTVLQTDNLSGTTMINSPRLQLSAMAQLDQPISDNVRLVGTAMESHVSKVIFTPTGLRGVLPDAADPGYWITNLRVGLRTADDKYEIAFYGNNLFNKAYYIYGSSSSSLGNLLGWGNPRVIGGEITVNF